MLPGFTWRTPSRRGWNGTREVGEQRGVRTFSKLQGASYKAIPTSITANLPLRRSCAGWCTKMNSLMSPHDKRPGGGETESHCVDAPCAC